MCTFSAPVEALGVAEAAQVGLVGRAEMAAQVEKREAAVLKVDSPVDSRVALEEVHWAVPKVE